MKTGMATRARGVRAYWLGMALGLSAWLAAFPAMADSKCKLAQEAEFPIRIEDGRAILTAGINGADARFTLDSGAFYSMLTSAAASQFKLDTRPAPFGFYVIGAHRGTADVSIATVKTFTLAGIDIPKVLFLVGGSDPRAGTVGLLGQNVLHIADDEYDLKRGVVRLMKPIDCGKAILAYWAAGTGQPYSVIAINKGNENGRHTLGSAYVNGLEIHVMFDTGAPTSILSTRTAARVGVTPDSPGTVSTGQGGGVGQGGFATYIAPFTSFKIGDEEIKNTKLRMGDIEVMDADMLLGMDFFLSHHIYVANSQDKMYFTYEGGPVFDLRLHRAPIGDSSTTGTAPAAQVGTGDATPPPAAGSAEQAADWSRQGSAAAQRGQLDVALADFNHACEISPDNPDYLYERGRAFWQNRQPAEARADFEHAIRVAPTHVPARIAHAELLLSQHDPAGAIADLDAADAAAAKAADIRFDLAELYRRADLLDRAVKQFDDWLEFHGSDMRTTAALNGRCWARALQGTDLPLALKDCNAARGRVEKSDPALAMILDSRALVYLRMKENEKSLADYDASLKINPKSAWGLYGRGIIEERLSKNAAGQADKDQAKTIWPKVAETFTRYGIGP